MSFVLTSPALPVPACVCVCAHSYCVPEEDKAALRQAIPSLLDDDSVEMSYALSSALAVMAKYDFPSVWPDLLSSLLAATIGAEQASSYLTALHFVVKMIATLDETREYNEFEGDSEIVRAYDLKIAQLREFSPDVVMALVTTWGEMTARLVQQIGHFIETGGKEKENGIDPRLCYDCLYSFRILHTLLIAYLPTLSQYNANFLVEFCTMVASRLENIALLVRITQNYPGSTHLNKLYLKLIKFVVHLQNDHPLTFTPVLLSFLNYFLKEFCDWKDEWRGIAILEIPLIHYMTFISNVLSTQSYSLKYLSEGKIDEPHNDPDIEIATADAVQTSHHIVTTFFSHQTLIYLLQTIVGRFFKIQPDRLEVWEESPEEYFEEDLTDATFTVKNTAEKLLYRLIRYDEESVCNEALRMLHQVRANCDKPAEEVSMEDILLKDACMSVLKYAYNSFSLNGMVDYETMQVQMLDADLAITDPRYKIIRKTIADIIGAWVDDIPSELHKRTWETLLNLFTDTDTIVKYSSIVSINNLLSSMDLDYEPYSSCIRPTVDYILGFLRDSQGTAFAMLILRQLGVFVVHLGDRISSYTTAIVEHITEFWNIADQTGQNDIKKPIVEILASLCESLPDYRHIYDSLIQVTRQTTDLEHPDSVLLLDPGLRLWWNLVQTADNITPDLEQLFPRLLQIYSRVPHDPNMISLTVRILESYFVLGGAQIVQNCVDEVTHLMEQLVIGTPRDLFLPVFDLMITFFQLFPNDAPTVVRPALTRVYAVLFYRFPNRTRIIHRASTLFMQILLKNPPFFFEFVSDPSLNMRNGTDLDTEAPLPLIRLVSRFLDIWRLLDFIEPEKVWAAGFSVLFASLNPNISHMFPQLVDACVSLLLTLRKQTKTVELRKRYTEHSDVITIKGSTVDVLRDKLKSADISKAPPNDVEDFAMNNIVSTLQSQGPEFEQQVAAAVEVQTRTFLTQCMSS